MLPFAYPFPTHHRRCFAGNTTAQTPLTLHPNDPEYRRARRQATGHARNCASGWGPTVLLGHPYDGIVITNAAYNNKNVTGLVYVAALAPDEGQSLGDFFDIAKLPKGNIPFCSKIEQWSL